MHSTIQVDQEIKEKLASFGHKGESYKDIINRLYEIAVQQQLREFLMTSENTMTLHEARDYINN